MTVPPHDDNEERVSKRVVYEHTTATGNSTGVIIAIVVIAVIIVVYIVMHMR
jgi:uncharacterized membrane protein